MREVRIGTLLLAAALALPSSTSASAASPSAVLQWDRAVFGGLRDSKLGAPVVARALAIVHTCIYDAWAAYDDRAVGTQLGDALRRPRAERIEANKEQAISYAAYRALVDVLPGDKDSVYVPLMKKLGYDPNDNSTDIETPTGIGNVACAAVLEFRHHDKSNQLGDLAQGPYSDWTGYVPVNSPSPVPMRTAPVDPNRWQPLTYVNSTGDLVTQRFMGAQWSQVTPFALSSADQFRSQLRQFGPATYGSAKYEEQARELINISAGLTDRQKMIAEYWSDGPYTEQPPGHWMRLAQWVSEREHHSLDDDVKMFFAVSNAMFDTGIATWDAKRAFDSVRPVTAVSFLYRGKKIRAWGGPGKGTVEMEGSQWIPYQEATSPTPPFPEFVSGHSAYSAAAAEILKRWTGNDRFGYSVTLAAGSSKIEPGITPSKPVVLQWPTFTESADEAGMSRRYGGIHFRGADLGGRLLGRLVAAQTWSEAQSYFEGGVPVRLHQQRAGSLQ